MPLKRPKELERRCQKPLLMARPAGGGRRRRSSVKPAVKTAVQLQPRRSALQTASERKSRASSDYFALILNNDDRRSDRCRGEEPPRARGDGFPNRPRARSPRGPRPQNRRRPSAFRYSSDPPSSTTLRKTVERAAAGPCAFNARKMTIPCTASGGRDAPACRARSRVTGTGPRSSRGHRPTSPRY
jgi:hypothetical protein